MLQLSYNGWMGVYGDYSMHFCTGGIFSLFKELLEEITQFCLSAQQH